MQLLKGHVINMSAGKLPNSCDSWSISDCCVVGVGDSDDNTAGVVATTDTIAVAVVIIAEPDLKFVDWGMKFCGRGRAKSTSKRRFSLELRFLLVAFW